MENLCVSLITVPARRLQLLMATTHRNVLGSRERVVNMTTCQCQKENRPDPGRFHGRAHQLRWVKWRMALWREPSAAAQADALWQFCMAASVACSAVFSPSPKAA